jgi:CHAD domain-containing protein
MEYTLGTDENTLNGIRRIAKGQLELAVRELSMSGEPVDARIHSVRKRMKKLRGLLRLVEGSLDEQSFERENACFRDAARKLASARRGAALLDTLDALCERFPDESGAVRETFRGFLVEERDRAIGEAHGERHQDEIDALSRALVRVDHWKLAGHDWKLIQDGFVRTYARGKRALEAAREQPTTEALHTWRRFAKYHWYHLRLLENVWPPVLHAFQKGTDELGELLGNEHDLDDLRQLILDKPAPESWQDALPVLLRKIDERRVELKRDAFALGTRVYAEKPRAAGRRMRGYFESITRNAE